MIKDFYDQMVHTQLTLADRLAIERTALANERTLLGYVRTMVGLMAVGVTLIKFFTDWKMVVAGWMFLGVGVVLVVIGFTRYLRMYTLMYALEHDQVEKMLKRDRFQHWVLVWLQRLKLVRI